MTQQNPLLGLGDYYWRPVLIWTLLMDLRIEETKGIAQSHS